MKLKLKLNFTVLLLTLLVVLAAPPKEWTTLLNHKDFFENTLA